MTLDEMSMVNGAPFPKPKTETVKPKTNADRIRQMTDEELAKFMRSCKFCAYLDKGCQHNGTCTQWFLEWLKQEASEDAGTD
jgi:hypothetical protein